MSPEDPDEASPNPLETSRTDQARAQQSPDPTESALQAVFMRRMSISASAFPPPQDLEIYERHHPGFLKELMARSAEAQRHDQDLTRLRLEGPLKFAMRGQLLGACVVLASIIGIVVCAYLDQPVIAGALGFVSLFPVISLFIRNPLAGNGPKKPTAPDA